MLQRPDLTPPERAAAQASSAQPSSTRLLSALPCSSFTSLAASQHLARCLTGQTMTSASRLRINVVGPTHLRTGSSGHISLNWALSILMQLRMEEKRIVSSTMDAVRARLAPIRGIPTKQGNMQDPNSVRLSTASPDL